MSEEHGHHAHPNYLLIFVALCVCTLLSAGADVMKSELGRLWLVAAVMLIACFKASFVMLYFMHLKFERAWKYALLAPTMILALCIPFALAPDIGFQYYMVQVPQNLVPAAGTAHAAEVHGTGPAHPAEVAHPTHPEPAAKDAPADKPADTPAAQPAAADKPAAAKPGAAPPADKQE